jgi:hypothetical protein
MSRLRSLPVRRRLLLAAAAVLPVLAAGAIVLAPA